MRVCVVVQGDLGRSPRMQYHVRSLLRSAPDTCVDFVGTAESSLVHDLQRAPRLTVHALRAWPALPLPFVLVAPLKVLWMTLTLFWVLLWRVPRPQRMLVQNPPSIPTLAVCVVVCWLRGCVLVVDWHNFGYTLLALRTRSAALLWVARTAEVALGRLAHRHLCVSDAMRTHLHQSMGIEGAVVVHDCPPEFFRRATAAETAALFAKPPLRGVCGDDARRPVAVTATSFTADENLAMLLDAVELLDAKRDGPALVLVITGKGDGRAAVERRVAAMQLRRCTVVTTYFEAFSDYACMLGSAHVGISMHASSSGYDLPMKVVDMLGCQLPVCSVRYACIDELVRHNVNGLLFDSASELVAHLCALFADFPRDSALLTRLRNNIRIPRWDDTWTRVALPCIVK